MKKRNLMILLSIVALVVSSFMIAGNVGAMYMSDGAVQDGVTGGWKVPTDFVCIVGVHADGTLDIADGVTDRHTCQYLTTGTMNGGTPFNLNTMTTSAQCTTAGGTGNDGAKHAFATSICLDSTGAGLSLVGLDRTYSMCVAKGGTWKQTSATPPYPGASGTFPTPGYTGTCTAYGAQFKGQDATGTPLAFGSKGTNATTAGYCYASVDWASVPGYAAATCPSLGATVAPYNANAAYDWAVSGAKCTYAKSIAGNLTSALTKANGTTYAAGSYIDLSTFTTMGDCLANGGSWNNWVGQAASITTVSNGTNNFKRPNWDYTRQAPDADNGCLHCHSSAVEYNGPAERWKDSYLKSGHKNMLRKVTPGMAWAGPDGVVYSQDTANHPIDFAAGTVGGGSLFYIFGDWMATYPNAVGPNGDTALYSCAACHTTGYNDGTNPGVQSIGTPGYAATKPGDYGGGYVSSVTPGHKWDLEGINCSRCHNAAVGPVSSTQIAASNFKTTAPTGGGMGALASGTGRNNLCFGCHQSIAKTWPTGANQFDPTLIPTGVSHGAAAGRDFNGHVLGNSFLNSVHARYVGAQSGNGSITLNSLGKYDLTDPNGTTEYGSSFKGYTCWQTSSNNSPAKTAIVNGQVVEITNKTQCESLYGTGAWRADQDGSLAATSIQGTCTTCHDIHNSLFVASQGESAIRKGCADCHVNNASIGATDANAPQVVLSAINHPTGSGTPFDTTLYGNDSCAVCHMATQAVQNGNQNSMPAHVWRINTDANYSTFPSVGQFYGGACSVHTGAVQNAPFVPVVYLSDISSANCTAASGTWTAVTKDRNAQTAPEYNPNGTVQYQNAVWVDVDMACGQCHGGSFGSANTHNGAMPMDKGTLATLASGMHAGASQIPLTASVNYSNDPNTSYLVNFDASGSSCSTAGQCVYQWSFGDGSALATTTTAANSHTYANANTVSATMTIVDTTTQAKSSATISVTPNRIYFTPTAQNTVTQAGWSLIVQDTSLTNDPLAPNPSSLAVSVDCGNGTKLTGVGGASFTCTYTVAGNYTIKETVTGAGGLSSSALNVTKSVPVKCNITGTVTRLDHVTPVSGAVVYLKIGTATKYLAVTAANGTYSIPGVVPASYTESVTKSGLTFVDQPVNTTSSCPASVNVSSNQ